MIPVSPKQLPADLDAFHGPNAAYVLELYDRYQHDPASVDAATRAFFDSWEPPFEDEAAFSDAFAFDVAWVKAATALALAIREYGHLAARLDPLGSEPPGDRELEPGTYGIREADLADLPASVVGGPASRGASTALEVIQNLRRIYCGTTGYDYDAVQIAEERAWLRDAAEIGRFRVRMTSEAKRELLERLCQVEAFEQFLHHRFPGQKRFSIEGVDSLVPLLDQVIKCQTQRGNREVILAMAHRGRLNTLAHVLRKPYDAILAEFERPAERPVSAASEMGASGWTGDVKYHLGARWPGRGTVVQVSITLAPNPSHLEFVNPIVEGMARAAQDRRDGPGVPRHDLESALAILIHGDAAFPGEGVVAETLNLSRLAGYQTGGTIHIILNNQIGFTTLPEEGRSTLYASDLAKGFEIPIIHVNADDPEACLAAARLACAYRDTFHKDFLIDLVGYRRWGHNEGDEPAFTQPRLYEKIRNHPTARQQWADELVRQGVVTASEAEAFYRDALDHLEQIWKEVQGRGPGAMVAIGEREGSLMRADGGAESVGVEEARERVEGEVSASLPIASSALILSESGNGASNASADQLRALNAVLHTFPEGFQVHPRLKRPLDRRRSALDPGAEIDWAHAESLALAAILADGTPIRLTGQDVERGTFSQRHLVLHDVETGASFTPLQALPQARATFDLHNSPLSETAPLGFEYGYAAHSPDVLVLWEAQFGDFVNAAQVIVDQFIASARAKWRQTPGLVLLLPHGYEGQGPEHSSARLERFLQLSANENLYVVNATTSAQYFHLLRRQAAALHRDPRPLIVMTPKSLLRHPGAASDLDSLVRGGFRPLIADPLPPGAAERVTRLILCSGKFYYELKGGPGEGAASEETSFIRVEQLYPFPSGELGRILAGLPRLREIVWAQEEPENMGAWRYIAPILREILKPDLALVYVGRTPRASPAEGSAEAHAAEQARIVAAAWGVRERRGERVKG